jgi:elongation factor Ts
VFNRIRENIRIARLASLQGNVGHYTHHNGQVAVLVEMSEACPPEASADVCMHIAALRPQCVRRDEVDAVEVQRQRAEFAQEAEGKPAPVMEKIVAGKLGRWFSEFVLLDQPFAKDDKISVAQYLDGVMKGLSVKRFIRFQVGGG